METTYHGSCHCRRVTFEVDIDLQAGTGKCNCSICLKTRNWNAIVKPEAFRLLGGGGMLTEYRFGTGVGEYLFCRHCGVHAFSRGHLEVLGGDFYSVRLNCLDDLDPTILADAPVRYADGRRDAWWERPAEVRHL